MKITIELSDAEVKGIKEYLKEVAGIEKPKKSDIKSIVDMCMGTLHTPQEAVSSYIEKYEKL